MKQAPRCSEFPTPPAEPLPGTAKRGNLVVALEYPHGWGRDVLDGEAFGAELSAALKGHLKRFGASLQLIRQPGKTGQQRTQRICFVAFGGGVGQPAVLERYEMNDPAGILELDLSGPGRNPGAREVTHPIVLICTHGKRDMCCALKGRPLAASLQSCHNPEQIWESSHTKGHRFAPAVLLLPWGYSYGRLNFLAAQELVAAANRGELYLPANRGCGRFDAPGQVAELAVAAQLQAAGQQITPGSLEVSDLPPHSGAGAIDTASCQRRVQTPQGAAYEVSLQQRQVPEVLSSCGGQPAPGTCWEAVAIRPVGAAI